MSKIEWSESVMTAGWCSGSDGEGVVVICKQARSPNTDQTILKLDIVLYLEEPVKDPRPSIEEAVKTLRIALGME